MSLPAWWLVVQTGCVEVVPSGVLRPHDWVQWHRGANRIFAGLALFREMAEAKHWPRWAQDVFWAVT